jgi:hypothetical protein
MIAKNKKGKSFGGCVRYVMNESCEMLEAEGVDANDAATITRDFAVQRSGRPEIKQPVGHIAVSFSPEDTARMTGDFMLKLAHEYMAEMDIRNTQYIVVRHHNTDHDHFHIVYNRIGNDLKLISVNNDYRRNVATCKKLKDRHGLTYGTGKEKVNRPKLVGADKVKYQIHDEIAANLPHSTSYADLEKRLRQAGITVQCKYRSGAEESPENIQGISFCKGGITFKGSQIDRKFSHANLSKTLSANLNEAWEKMKDIIMPEVNLRPDLPKPSASEAPKLSEQEKNTLLKYMMEPEVRTAPQKPQAPEQQPQSVTYHHTINGAGITDEQWDTLQSGGHIYVKNMARKSDGLIYSSHVFLDDEKKWVFYSADDPDKFVKYGKYEMRLRDKMQVEQGFVTKAKVKWYGGRMARPYLWKGNPDDNDYKESWYDPRIPREQSEKEKQALVDRFRQPAAPNRTPPAINRTIPPHRTIPPKRSVPPLTKGPKMRR